MSGGTISTSETRIETLKLQSSSYGVTVPLLYGLTRVPGNLVWYGGFKATPHTSTDDSGGKGGVKTQNTTYSYSASVMMGLAHGLISGIPRVWKGSAVFKGGYTPAQIVTVTETFYSSGTPHTTAQAAKFLATVSVTGSTGSGDSFERFALAQGSEYTLAAGVYTFMGIGLGCDVTLVYQYATSAFTQGALQQLGLSFISGAIGQPVWAPLSTLAPAQAIGYSGMALVAGQDYNLGTGAQVENHLFEVQAAMAYSVSINTPDADPADIVADVLANARYGAAFPALRLGDMTAWGNYNRAAGLLCSPAITEQVRAADLVTMACRLTNTAPVWSGSKLKFVPYGDAVLTGNGRTFTPNVTPLYDLTDDHFIDKDNPVEVQSKAPSERFNHVRIEYRNRGAFDAGAQLYRGQYSIEIAEAKDAADIDANGLRSAAVEQMHWICDAAVARTVAQLLLQRSLYVTNTYRFELPWTFALVEPMDLLTLTDPDQGLNRTPVRVTERQEAEDGTLTFTCEDFPLGIASATLYASQGGSGFAHDYNAAPGSASAPLIFEAPGALTVNGLEVYVAATGTGANWGGCNVWVSLDGSNYKRMSTITGGSRYGTLTAAAGASGAVAVALLRGTLTSGSAADAAALNTLCFIKGASAEYFGFDVATLTGALSYTLGASARGVYGTPAAAHASGDGFVRIDSAIGKSGPIDLGYVGKTIHVKMTSFNLYGAAEESLATVTDYTYAITGAQIYGNAGAAALAGITSAASDNIISAGEKPPIILDYTNLVNEHAGLDAQAAALAVSSAAYDAAYAALVTTYLPSLTTPTLWSNVAGDTNVVGTTFRATWAAVYAAKQALVNVMMNAAANATADLVLVVTGTGLVLTGNSVNRPTGGGNWDAQCYSRDAYTGGAACSFSVAASNYFIGGLNTDPLTDASYTSIDFGIMVRDTLADYAYENGTATLLDGVASVASDVLTISYDGQFVRYMRNGNVLRTVPAAPGLKFFFDSSVLSSGIHNIRFSAHANSFNSRTGNLIDASWWRPGLAPTSGAQGWTPNQGAGSDAFVVATLPDGSSGIVWQATSDTANGAGGGWNPSSVPTDLFPVNPQKTYLFACYTKGVSGIGNEYLGVSLGGEVCDLNTTTPNTNPYFSGPVVHDNSVWHLHVGWVYPAGTTGHLVGRAGSYNCATGALLVAGANYNWAAATQQCSTRAYQFYCGAGTVGVQQFVWPAVYLCDGSEPSVDDLLSMSVKGNVAAANAAAAAAAATAAAAQTSASAANTAITNIGSDNILSPGEKPVVVQDYAVITGEQAGIDAQATAFAVTTELTAYDAAITALTAYLGTLSGWNTLPGSDVVIVGTTFRSKFADVYTAKQALLNKIAAIAATRAAWANVSGVSVTTGQIAANAATEVYVTTPGAAVNVTALDHTPDGYSFNTQVTSVSFTPSQSGIAQVFFDGRGRYVNSNAGVSGAAWSIQNTGAAYDGWKRIDIGVSSSSTLNFSMQTTRSIPVTGGTAYTFAAYANKLYPGDTLTIDNMEMRVEVIKR